MLILIYKSYIINYLFIMNKLFTLKSTIKSTLLKTNLFQFGFKALPKKNEVSKQKTVKTKVNSNDIHEEAGEKSINILSHSEKVKEIPKKVKKSIVNKKDHPQEKDLKDEKKKTSFRTEKKEVKIEENEDEVEEIPIKPKKSTKSQGKKKESLQKIEVEEEIHNVDLVIEEVEEGEEVKIEKSEKPKKTIQKSEVTLNEKQEKVLSHQKDSKVNKKKEENDDSWTIDIMKNPQNIGRLPINVPINLQSFPKPIEGSIDYYESYINSERTTPETRSIIKTDHQYNCRNYSPLPLVVKEGRGCVIEDIDGFKYIDCLMGYSSVNLGHHNIAIEKEIENQMSKIYMTARPFYNTRLPDTAKLISEIVGKDKICIANGGVEACETALKFARRWGYRVKNISENKAKTVVAAGNFMGRTITVCGASLEESRYKHFGPYAENAFEIIPYNDIQALEAVLESDPNICSVILEPIQGEGGIIIPDDNYLSQVYDLCKKYNVLYIDDEIQAGLGRSGRLFASQYSLKDKKPDIYLLAKSISNGYYPVSIVAANKDIIDLIGPGEHGSTFSGNPLAMAIAETALKELIKDNGKTIDNSFEMGSKLCYLLYSINSPLVKEIRGRGLFIGIEFHHDIPINTSDILLMLMERGLASKQTHKYTIRLTPSLNITWKEVEAVYHIFKNVLESLSSQIKYESKENTMSNFLLTKSINDECIEYLNQNKTVEYKVKNPKQEAYKLNLMGSIKISEEIEKNNVFKFDNKLI